MQLPLVTGERPLPKPVVADGPLVDAQGRRITYLRVSVTDRCNFRCTYCSPSNWAGKLDFLSADELVRLVSVFASLGVNRVRLTGGEPLLRDDLVDVARRIAALSGMREVCLTTNGHRLEALATRLVEAGVSAVNVSVDTLDAGSFREVTKKGDLPRVLGGLEAAAKAGFSRVGVNAVVMAGVNDSPATLASVARLAWRLGAVPRFIERMPFAGAGEVVSLAEVRRRMSEEGLAFEPIGARDGAGPATYFRAKDRGVDVGEAGFIGAMTENFCTRCNRVRLSSTGELRACLGGRDQVPLAPLLREGASDADLAAAIRGALLSKWDGHRFVEDGESGLLPMMGIGG